MMRPTSGGRRGLRGGFIDFRETESDARKTSLPGETAWSRGSRSIRSVGRTQGRGKRAGEQAVVGHGPDAVTIVGAGRGVRIDERVAVCLVGLMGGRKDVRSGAHDPTVRLDFLAE